VDPGRTGIPPSLFDAGFGFAAYADYVLAAATIVRGGAEDSPLQAALHESSMVFPDVRLRQYIEVRVADSCPIERALAYAALLKGIFSDRDTVRTWLEKLGGGDGCGEILRAQDALMAQGEGARVYGFPVRALLEQMTETALARLPKDERYYITNGVLQHVL
ncbi:MAG: hypothetical protein LBQ33_04635, partial [Oscillospiraceae bacterium]|jgi:glutamate--cysteine ligase|nr:hypothetical protein [Oscillospiraceae bacterium]